jgi:hypothetical protein
MNRIRPHLPGLILGLLLGWTFHALQQKPVVERGNEREVIIRKGGKVFYINALRPDLSRQIYPPKRPENVQEISVSDLTR